MKELHTGIYEVEGFIPNDDLSVLVDYVTGADDSEWFKKNSHGLFIEVNREDVQQILDSYVAKLGESFSGKTVLPIKRISRLTEGKNMGVHSDNLSEPRCIRGVILYLNDDYSGGEIHYRDVDVTYKPKAGSVIIHDSSYLHEVLPVTEGTRYMVTTFVWE